MGRERARAALHISGKRRGDIQEDLTEFIEPERIKQRCPNKKSRLSLESRDFWYYQKWSLNQRCGKGYSNNHNRNHAHQLNKYVE